MSKNNTFSLGVCNGCQLMCNLGLIGKIFFNFAFLYNILYNKMYIN